MQQHVGFFHWPRQGPRYWLQHTRDELLTYNNTAVTLRSGTFATVFGGFCLLSFLLFFFFLFFPFPFGDICTQGSSADQSSPGQGELEQDSEKRKPHARHRSKIYPNGLPCWFATTIATTTTVATTTSNYDSNRCTNYDHY